MARTLNLLLVEDNPDDAGLLLAELRRAGFAPVWKRVETAPEFLAELEKAPDIIISDFSLPKFSGLQALKLLRQSALNIPFILVSGTVGEDVAVESMKLGATDYLLKDRTVRLGSAVQRALEQKQLLAERRKTEASLNLFRSLVEQAHDAIEVIDPATGRFLDANETACQRLGYSRAELLTLTVPDVEAMAVNAGTWGDHVKKMREKGFAVLEGRHKRKDGSTFPVEVNVRLVKLDREYLIASVRDITDRKRKDEEIQNQLNELQRWHEAMLGREDRILELKREVNELLAARQLPLRYAQNTMP